MSAIVGFFRLRGRPAEPALLDAMLEQLAHRGPDGSGGWHEGPVALGHLRLRTTPEQKGESLPLVARGGELVLTADARLDNRAELIDSLGLADRGALSDGELILAAYERWGEECVERLLGDFAFVLWDGRRRTLFCARDHFGVRPLYYYLSDDIFAFATEIKALFCLPDVPRRINERRVADFLAICDPVEPFTTLYDGIRRFPTRSCASVSEGGMRLSQYWAPDPTREIRLGSDAEYQQAFRHHFTEAVHCRMQSDRQVGSMLSGGIDSSSITCMARHLLRESGGGSLPTFSVVFDEVAESDERRYIETVIEGGAIDPFTLSAESVSPLTDLDRVLWHHDQANPAGNLYVSWCLARAAHEKGVRVLLDGYDGDTTLSHGHGYLIELARDRRWPTLAMEMREWGRKVDAPEPWLRSWLRWLQKYEIDPVISAVPPLRLGRRAWRALSYRARGAFSQRPPERVTTLIRPEFSKRTGVPGPKRAAAAPLTTERQCHYKKLAWDLHAEIMEGHDKVAGAFEMEIRFPFWDRRLVEFCLALPAEQKRRRGWSRWIIRPALEGVLPTAIQWRGNKSNLSYGFEHGLRKWERQRLDRLMKTSPEMLAEYVDVTAMRGAYDRFVSGAASSEESLALWRAIALALWMERERNASAMPSAALSRGRAVSLVL